MPCVHGQSDAPAAAADVGVCHIPPAQRRRILRIPPLRRISSDWEPERDISHGGRLHPRDIRNEFESLDAVKRCVLTAARPGKSFHHRYFRSQTEDSPRLRIPVDPIASNSETVVVDAATHSIFDAYLLRASIAKNDNEFHRQQVVFSSSYKTYSVIVRSGRVGFAGRAKRELETSDLKVAVAKFFGLFHKKTGKGWYQRHGLPSAEGSFNFVELDYSKAYSRPQDLPNYEHVDAGVSDEIRDLMEVVLHGGPMQNHRTKDKQARKSPFYAFSAPYKYMSSWAIFLAFKTLEAICKHLESGSNINWRVILRATSRYRSQMPFSSQHNRPPVISSYHAIFIELRFLHSLWPRPETADMLAEIYRRGIMQLHMWKTFARPLYQAYSSLRHGFRRLTDASTLEFRELKSYLEKSCHRSHFIALELQDIYQVFVKAKLSNPYNDWIKSKTDCKDECGEERRLLWHGTPLDSVLGILDTGLQIRRRGATLTGAMFGDGIYLADASSKSANFCKQHDWDGEAVLFLCEADVGKRRMRLGTSLRDGHTAIANSTWGSRCIEGLGKIGPRAWKKAEWEMGGLPRNDGAALMPDVAKGYGSNGTAGCLMFNEYVVYSTAHVTLRYLFRVKIKNGRR